MDMSTLMQQAQQMQQRMKQLQTELANREVSASAGGGMVTVTATGNNELRSVRIHKEVVNPDDTEMLEDLVLAAVNEAMIKAREMAQAEMKKLTGGVNIPGLF